MSGELRVEDVPDVLARDAEFLACSDPRMRRLASARWRLATGGSHEEWLRLRETEPERIVRDVQGVLRRGAELLHRLADEGPDESRRPWDGS